MRRRCLPASTSSITVPLVGYIESTATRVNRHRLKLIRFKGPGGAKANLNVKALDENPTVWRSPRYKNCCISGISGATASERY
jgi:hypothetical protein